jgi:hypothetical protein
MGDEPDDEDDDDKSDIVGDGAAVGDRPVRT